MGPIAIFDKSTLQALSMDEAVWLDTFFLANITPLFYVETLADLEKQVAAGRTPEDVVGALAAKTPVDGAPNVHHLRLVSSELAGNPIEMNGRIIVSGGDLMEAPDGSTGIHIDEFPEAVALLRWQNHEFVEIERDIARDWRAGLAAHDPDQVIKVIERRLPSGARASDLPELKRVIDAACAKKGDRDVLTLALDLLDVPWLVQWFVLRRWTGLGGPSLDSFAPFTAHVFKVDLLYYLGIRRGFISGERHSNRADMAYLYYLPFAMVFFSGDNLHSRTVPLFLRADQSYVGTGELKAALGEIDAHYDRLPDETKERGVLQFASFPPSELDNVVADLWDKHMRPDWRDAAHAHEKALETPRDEPRDREKIADIKGRLDQARPISRAGSLGSDDADYDDADYVVIRRQFPVRRGKWRTVPKEAEDLESDE